MCIEDEYDKIYRYCYFKLRSRETAEDITQETFLRYFERFDDRDSVAVLYTIAKNLCIDKLRKIPFEPLDEEVPAASHEDEVVGRLTVRAALEALTDEHREVLLLRYANELGISQIAGILGISRFAVSRRLKAAEKSLRELLGKDDY